MEYAEVMTELEALGKSGPRKCTYQMGRLSRYLG